MNTVTVLMSTYNGEKYLAEQIDSLLQQKEVKIQILVRDDGSTDHTQKMLEKYQSEGILTWYTGSNLRSAKSFMDLVKNAPESEYYAFCDQDDVWKEDKLSHAIMMMRQKEKENNPVLYCSDYQLVDADLHPLTNKGHQHRSMTTFNAGILSSCATGCTVVFNKAVKALLCEYTPSYQGMHDSWACRVCLAVGGSVIFDENYKALYYRQHGNNVVGAVPSKITRIKRLWGRITKKECAASKQAEELLKGYGKYMSKENYTIADIVANYRKSIRKWFRLLFSKTIITPYKDINLGIKVAILLRYL